MGTTAVDSLGEVATGDQRLPMPSPEETIAFIQMAHAGQFDKGGKPYWLHPFSVMHRLGKDASNAEKIVALLHDVLEDTPTTAWDLHQRGYSNEVIDAVVLLSRPEGCTYMGWISDLAASGNRIAIKVKIADNEDNSDPARIAVLPEGERDIVRRYERSLKILRATTADVRVTAQEPATTTPLS